MTITASLETEERSPPRSTHLLQRRVGELQDGSFPGRTRRGGEGALPEGQGLLQLRRGGPLLFKVPGEEIPPTSEGGIVSGRLPSGLLQSPPHLLAGFPGVARRGLEDLSAA